MNENRKLPIVIFCYTLAILIVVFNHELFTFLGDLLSTKMNEHRLSISWLLLWISFFPLVLIRHITKQLWLSFVIFLIFGLLFKINGL